MDEKKQKRLSPDIIEKDNDAYLALKNMSDYNPNNAAYKLSAVSAAKQLMDDKREAEKLAEDAAKKAQDATAKAEHDFHDLMQGASNQVLSQYGASSDEIAAMGYKKKDEYKRPGGRPKKNP